MTKIFSPLIKLNWKLLITLFITLLIPTIYRTIRMHFIGDMPNTYSYSIAGNMQWINVMFEVLEEAFLLPMFFSLSKIIEKRGKTNEMIMGKLYQIIIIYLIAIITFVILTPQLLIWLSPNTYSKDTVTFIRVEFINRLFVMSIKVGSILLIAKNMWKKLIQMLAIQMVLSILLDIFMISDLSVSAKLGIIGIAIDDSISNIILMFIYAFLIRGIYKIKKTHILKPLWKSNTSSWKQNLYSGLESFIRNAFFIWFVIKTIGHLDSGYSQGDWWATNSFIWGWLLLPVLSLSQYMNRDTAFNKRQDALYDRIGGPFIIITMVIIMWLILIPSYEPFARVILNNKDSKVIAHLVEISLGFYALFAYNEIIDKIFYGSGKAEYMLFQSIITNIIVYIPYYYLSKTMTLDSIAIMFGVAMSVDTVLTFAIFIFAEKIKQKNRKESIQTNV